LLSLAGVQAPDRLPQRGKEVVVQVGNLPGYIFMPLSKQYSGGM
jgi:hypothetical protein